MVLPRRYDIRPLDNLHSDRCYAYFSAEEARRSWLSPLTFGLFHQLAYHTSMSMWVNEYLIRGWRLQYLANSVMDAITLPSRYNIDMLHAQLPAAIYRYFRASMFNWSQPAGPEDRNPIWHASRQAAFRWADDVKSAYLGLFLGPLWGWFEAE